ncbi:hypothetical protein E9998_01430 [Glycomyces paridis]|uniref:Uncharacterized protein n=1 Tax=Glycomyces paridis TaxID=2126555 RepID=A0A4S8PV82_9ACTN|nr:hypothetical protein E9998_01430 [Glycomyces paridis]
MAAAPQRARAPATPRPRDPATPRPRDPATPRPRDPATDDHRPSPNPDLTGPYYDSKRPFRTGGPVRPYRRPAAAGAPPTTRAATRAESRPACRR